MSNKFQYPVGDGTRETFERDWYVALGFGAKTDYGYHEGADINLKTGGDSDNGKPIFAIADWKIDYYHNSHPESGFGTHFIYRVESPWGPRWIHPAHCQKPLDWTKVTSGKKGDKLAEIDKTGRPRLVLPAHVHLTVFKKDPAGLPNKIDSIFKTLKDLNEWCEDPIDFFRKWYDYKEDDMDIKQLITDLRDGLLGVKPSPDELTWDSSHWSGAKDFIQRITGDSKFYAKYVLPQLENQKIAQENACNKEKEALNKDWQTKLDSAKKDYEKQLSTKLENTTIGDLISLIIVKVKESLGKG